MFNNAPLITFSFRYSRDLDNMKLDLDILFQGRHDLDNMKLG